MAGGSQETRGGEDEDEKERERGGGGRKREFIENL